MFKFHIRTRSLDSPFSLGSPKPAVETPRSSNGGSPRADVGEIDTSAPFQSVKAALSLFGTSPRNNNNNNNNINNNNNKSLLLKKPKTADERVLEKESALHLALKELEDLRGRLKSTETTKVQAFRDLEKANRTLEELTSKLEIISESKHTAIEATEAAKQRAKDLEEQQSSRQQVDVDTWKQDVVDSAREQYKASAAELISAKQELTTLRQDFDIVLEAKLAAFQQAADAQHITQVNKDGATQISKEITTLREALEQVKLDSLQAQEERNKHNDERQARFQSHETAKEKVELQIKSLKEECDSGKNLEVKLEETTEAIKLLQEQLNNIRDSDMSSLKIVTAELQDAKKNLQEILEEENSQRSSVDFLKLELDNVKREHSELKHKALEAESTAQTLQVELERYKAQLEAALAGDLQAECDDIQLKIQHLASQAENAREEVVDINKNISLLKQDAETACIAAKEAEERLKIALDEVEAARAAERHAGDMIHNSSQTDAAQGCSTSNSHSKIKLSVEDFESLSKKGEESKADADIKVATVMAQIETIKASESEMLKKLESSMKEKEEIEAAIEDALKQAEMAEAAKLVVEGELIKRRQKAQEDVVEESFNSNEINIEVGSA